MLACPTLQQLRIHLFTNGPHMVRLDTRLWRDVFLDVDGNSCLPQSSLRRLELSAAPSNLRLSNNEDGTRFPSLEWLPELVLQSECIQVDISPSLSSCVRRL